MPVEPETGDRGPDVAEHVRPSFPLRPGKVQRPLLPPETLRRDRLFDWLKARATRRVVYVVAEAGFGKTTLVADFLRRSRVRTFWYRLDEDDTDGLGFLRYLVAACQAVDPRLLQRSAALLSESAGEPTREETVLRTLLAEMDCLGEVPSALVLDDFHVVEDVPAIGAVVERLISRSPAQLSLILASRRTPNLAAAALRARGELAELGREELRFDESETGRLFRESYHNPLEPDVLHDLQARTEGWAASLQLVKAAVDGRSTAQVRAFVQSPSGAEGDLYDYLAEEVFGELASDLRGFLMRVALLEEIDPEMAAVAAGVSGPEARRLIGHAQRLGLLSRGVDFIYDDWASAFRDTLHASFLDRIERAVVADTKAGAFDRALSVAQLALQADPDAEQIELCLLRLYRRTGAHAAAAEQYAHYATVMREQLGIEPPPLDSI